MDGDVLYAEFYDRIINQPEESVYQTVTDGMNLLKTESAVLQISEGSLKVKFILTPNYRLLHQKRDNPKSWPFYDHCWPFFANYMEIFHKNVV